MSADAPPPPSASGPASAAKSKHSMQWSHSHASWKQHWGRALAILLGVTYFSIVLGGYILLKYVRGVERISLPQIAFFQIGSIQRTMARQMFLEAGAAAAKHNYKLAFMEFTGALHKDPDNIEGRLKAAEFLGAVGAPDLQVQALTDGLIRQPHEPRLIEQTFPVLVSSGRDEEALRMLDRSIGGPVPDRDAQLMIRCKLTATLHAKGASAAREFLGVHPELREEPDAVPTVARVLWETDERKGAVALLGKYVDSPTAQFGDFMQLAAWQEAQHRIDLALGIAHLAARRMPDSAAARAMLVEYEALSEGNAFDWPHQAAAYFARFGQDPAAVRLLAQACGRRGWADFARMLYVVSLNDAQSDPMLALYLADAVSVHGNFDEVWKILSALDAQSDDDRGEFRCQLLERKVMAAASLNNPEGVRESARQLAELLRGNTGALATLQRFFARLGIPEAAAQFVPGAPKKNDKPTSAPNPTA